MSAREDKQTLNREQVDVCKLLTLLSKKSAVQNYGEHAEIQKQPWAARICRIFSTSRSQASRLSFAISRSILPQQFNGSVLKF